MTKSEKVPILGIFSLKTILMFRVGLKKIWVGRPKGTTHTFHLSLSFLIYVVSQGGSDGLQTIVLFGMCILANSVKQVVTFSVYVSMLSCFNICQSVCWISSRNELKSHLSYSQMCPENVDFALLSNLSRQNSGQW